ncbi:hypothetical protein GQ53DRAFT_767709 [Thozetella sp. PMI_491]|nr:hypothetical protein GQ53DRAFT_767709 [Thozetella sp. PMI_491]
MSSLIDSDEAPELYRTWGRSAPTVRAAQTRGNGSTSTNHGGSRASSTPDDRTPAHAVMAASSPASGVGGQQPSPPRPSSLGQSQPQSRSNASSNASEFPSSRKRSLYDDDDDDDDDDHTTKREPGVESMAYHQLPSDTHAPSPTDSSHNGHIGQRRHSDDLDGAATGAPNKKRKTGPGSRGVANLTPEQLAKKRANDREAQRAIRERQKAKNQEYERRIRELESQQPYQELQAALRLKDAVEAENADIKRVLASIVAMIQPLLARPSDHNQPPVYPSPNQSYVPVQPDHNAPPSLNNVSTPTSAASPTSVVGPHSQQQQQQQWQGEMAHAGQAQAQAFAHSKMLGQQRQDLVHGLDMGAEKLGLGFLLDPNQRIARIQSGVNGAQNSPQFRHMPMKHDWTASAMPVPGQPPQYTSSQQNGPRMDYPIEPLVAGSAEGSSSGGTEEWSTPIQNCPPTCPLDSLMLDFLNERRQRAAEGHSPQEIVGPRYPVSISDFDIPTTSTCQLPIGDSSSLFGNTNLSSCSVSSLLNPARSRFAHPLSKVFTDILATFPDLSSLPERIAVLYLMFLLMRWQIHPTRENYDRLPGSFRPLPAQLIRPHPAWVDHIPFPAMRETLIDKYGADTQGRFPFSNFFIPFTSTLSVNWPYEDTDTVLQNPDSDDVTINPVFERHLRRIENWSLGDSFHQAFPELAGTYTLKSDPQLGSSAAQAGAT